MTKNNIKYYYNNESVSARIDVHQSAVEILLLKNETGKFSTDHFKTLISSETTPFLNKLIQQSAKITKERFGSTIQLFAPLYLSNECQNICTYCGFSFTNKIPRKTLNDAEILQEIEVLKLHGFDSVLLVTGEHDKHVGVDYLLHAVQLVKQHFAQVSIEVQPLETEDYIKLKNAGVYSVLVYQETYSKDVYKQTHPKGKKANFDYRIATPDRIGAAEMYKIGLGVLFGLSNDWRTEALQLAIHLDALQKKYWQSKFSISFPRLRPFEGEFEPQAHLSEKELIQLICAFRISFPDVELSLSTRERPEFRDIAVECGITSMSAGSKTEPGGYSNSNALKQFDIHDERTPEEIASMIKSKNYEVVWKDWDAVLI
ncbi:MAG: 2-iminoacetate synthase ThiH [Chitinophagales bacterium]